MAGTVSAGLLRTFRRHKARSATCSDYRSRGRRERAPHRPQTNLEPSITVTALLQAQPFPSPTSPATTLLTAQPTEHDCNPGGLLRSTSRRSTFGERVDGVDGDDGGRLGRLRP